jgi:hypothetical protein
MTAAEAASLPEQRNTAIHRYTVLDANGMQAAFRQHHAIGPSEPWGRWTTEQLPGWPGFVLTSACLVLLGLPPELQALFIQLSSQSWYVLHRLDAGRWLPSAITPLSSDDGATAAIHSRMQRTCCASRATVAKFGSMGAVTVPHDSGIWRYEKSSKNE